MSQDTFQKDAPQKDTSDKKTKQPAWLRKWSTGERNGPTVSFTAKFYNAKTGKLEFRTIERGDDGTLSVIVHPEDWDPFKTSACNTAQAHDTVRAQDMRANEMQASNTKSAKSEVE